MISDDDLRLWSGILKVRTSAPIRRRIVPRCGPFSSTYEMPSLGWAECKLDANITCLQLCAKIPVQVESSWQGTNLALF